VRKATKKQQDQKSVRNNFPTGIKKASFGECVRTETEVKRAMDLGRGGFCSMEGNRKCKGFEVQWFGVIQEQRGR
jgi:hypothetical protein